MGYGFVQFCFCNSRETQQSFRWQFSRKLPSKKSSSSSTACPALNSVVGAQQSIANVSCDFPSYRFQYSILVSWYPDALLLLAFFSDKDRRAYIPLASNQSKPGKRWNMKIIFPVLEFICAPGLSTNLLNENKKYRCLTPVLESRGVFSFHNTFSISFSF